MAEGEGAAAVEELGNLARQLGKLGFKVRWGDLSFWWAETEAPWRPTREDFREYFWSVIRDATQDISWQVRVSLGARARVCVWHT